MISFSDYSGPPDINKLKDYGDINGLIKALSYEKDYSVRKYAAIALGEIGEGCAVDPLIANLNDKDKNVHNAAADALGKIGYASVEPLIAILKAKEGSMRSTAAKVLGNIGDARAVDPLIAALKDGTGSVAAAEALGNIRDVRAMEPLITALKDGDENIRDASATALGKIGDVRAVDSLIAALKDEDVWVRKSAAEALGKIGDALSVEPLTDRLRDPNESERKRLVEALEDIRDTTTDLSIPVLPEMKSAEALIKKLKDNNPDEKIVTIKLLSAFKFPAVVDALLTALKENEDWKIKREVAESLSKMGELAEEPLKRALKISDKVDEAWILNALKNLERSQKPVNDVQIKEENWRFAVQLFQLTLFQNSKGYLVFGTDDEVKRIGTYLGKTGGTKRMETVLKMVNVIDSEQGCYRAVYQNVSMLWNNICGWYS